MALFVRTVPPSPSPSSASASQRAGSRAHPPISSVSSSESFGSSEVEELHNVASLTFDGGAVESDDYSRSMDDRQQQRQQQDSQPRNTQVLLNAPSETFAALFQEIDPAQSPDEGSESGNIALQGRLAQASGLYELTAQIIRNEAPRTGTTLSLRL